MTNHRITNEPIIRADGTDFTWTVRIRSRDRDGNTSFGIHRSHSDALSRDLSLSRVPRRHYEERSRQPV